MNDRAHVVDVDDPSTWPAAVVEALDAGPEQFREELNCYRLRAHHCTTLLGHELETVRKQGLVPLTASLLEGRIRAAHAHGHIGADVCDELLRSHMFAVGDGSLSGRRDQVCAVLSRTAFDTAPRGCAPLMTCWGGEGIYMALHRDSEMRRGLRRLGVPSIVVVDIDPSTASRGPNCWPSECDIFRSRSGGRDAVYGDYHHYGPVPPDGIVNIWQPGHPEYDLHPLLPRHTPVQSGTD